MKFLSKYMDLNSMKRIITSHYFGMLYYGSPVWLNELTSSRNWKMLNTLHYKGLRVACRDYRRVLRREILDNMFKRATPHKWKNYANAKLALQILSQGSKGPPIYLKLRQNIGYNDRTKRITTMDTSRIKIGQHSFQNRLQCLRELKFKWKKEMSKDQLRTNLKRTFF